jgi:serine/threonine-protein kinase PpkA
VIRLLKCLLFSVVMAAFLVAVTGTQSRSQDAKPLLMPEKQTIYQRVLTRPEAQLMAHAGDAKGTLQPALSRFYVYERKDLDGKEWLLVGADSHGKTDGWMAADATLPWKQQMTLAFTNPANRDRTLMFKNRKDVLNIVQAEIPAVAVAPIRQAVETGKGDPRILSIEPAEYIDIHKKFYLLPILEAEEVVTNQGYVRVLEVASVTADGEATSPAASGATEKPEKAAVLRTFTAAVVFVIDSTISMGPYIDRTREAVRRIYDKVEKAGLLDQVRFGLIAYRSNVKASPGLEYVSKVYADPTEVKDGHDFLNKVADLRPATVSSARFDEDAYSGVMSALQGIKWSEFGGRYVVLITDAGALKGSDELSGTQLGAEQVQIEAERLGLALYTLHLKTPAGKRNHASAEQQYRTLTNNAIARRSLYYPVDAGSVDEFGRIVDGLSDAIVQQVRAASMGELSPGSARTAKPDEAASEKQEAEKPMDLVEQAQSDARLLGHAMALAYLGRVQGTEAPKLFTAWLADRDFANPDLATTEVRVLVTKNELSNLHDVVKAILDAGEKAQNEVGTADFFDLLRSSAAHLARDPNQLNDPNATKLGELGLLDEFLDGLPYKSDVMMLTSDRWEQWSTSEQEDFLDNLRRKLRLYQIYHDDTDLWIALSEGADPGESVYPVPIKALP